MTTGLATGGGDEMRRLAADEFREVIGHFASGVTVITTIDEGHAHGTTASAFTSLSLEPPMVLVCMNKESDTGVAIQRSGRFAVNILGDHQPDAALHFAGKGDKFAGVTTTPGEWGEPLLPGSLATLECVVTEETSGGTHLVFLAEVHRASIGTGSPLAYFRGRFGRLELVDDERTATPGVETVLRETLAATRAALEEDDHPDSPERAEVERLLDELDRVGDQAIAALRALSDKS